jgi:hypothetical protein
MIEHSETVGNLRIYQEQVDGWITGTYNTFVTYSGETLAIKYHYHETRKHDKKNPADGIYNLLNGQDIIGQCSLCKNLLNDVAFLKKKIETKISAGIIYNFDIKFVGNIFKNIINAAQKKIESIYFDLQFEAASNGKAFNIPLPDYAIKNTIKEPPEKKDDTIQNDGQNEIIEMIRESINKADYIIEFLKELKTDNNRPKYVYALMEQGYVGKDGVTALTGLDNIAEFLSTNIEIVTPQLLLQFRQSDGKEYSLRTAQDAVRRNKAQ